MISVHHTLQSRLIGLNSLLRNFLPLAQVFHEIEKKIIGALREKNGQGLQELESTTGLLPDQLRRGMEWLRLKNLASVKESRQTHISLGKNGLYALLNGLPERQLLDLLADGPRPVLELQEKLKHLFGPAMGIAKRNNWISGKETVSRTGVNPALPEEALIRQIGRIRIPKSELGDQDTLALLGKRPDFVVEETAKSVTVSLLDPALKVGAGASDSAIDVEADVPAAYIARTNPLSDTIREIREIFVTLGFSEIAGNLSQSSFWNFDALFTPQDHPAREMHDTFYLDGIRSERFATAQQMRQVSQSHRKNWGQDWSAAQARRTVLRTHTTCVTIRHLAQNRPDEARVFSLGRVFRNEKASYKHLVEFNQVEGIVTGADATLRELMGIQLEFYRRIGLERVKFWPTFFPYTEPSLQTMVYNQRLKKWVELFGMGIFRPEVTRPLGISRPVLAWGGGIERIAMIKYGIDDVREFYNNDLKWMRGAAKCQ